MQRRWAYVLLVVAQTVVFGLGNVVTKTAYESITPLWCQVLRFGLAAAVFAIAAGPRIVRQLRAARLRDWVPSAACMAASYLACNVALDMTSATNVGFLVALPVVFAPLISSLVARRRYPVAYLPFQAAVVVGLYLLCSGGGAFSFGPGEALALASSVALAGALVFGERGLARLDVAAVAGSQVGMAFLMALVLAVVAEPPVRLAAVEPIAWGVIVFLALASTCLAFVLQNKALTGLKSSTVSLLLTGEPVFTAVFAFALLGEVLDARATLGACVIVAAVVAATAWEGRQAGREDAAAPGASGAAAPASPAPTLSAAGAPPVARVRRRPVRFRGRALRLSAAARDRAA